MSKKSYYTTNIGPIVRSRYLESPCVAATTAKAPRTPRSGNVSVIPARKSSLADVRTCKTPDAGHLFDIYDQKRQDFDAALWSRDLVALCPRDGRTQEGLSTLRDDVMSITTSDCAESMLHYAMTCDGPATIMALDIDLMDSCDDTVQRLLALRRTNPCLTIVLMSRTFAKSDFSTDRHHIADASVRLPTSHAILANAIQAAALNTNERLKLCG